jgi:hypothetical protein
MIIFCLKALSVYLPVVLQRFCCNPLCHDTVHFNQGKAHAEFSLSARLYWQARSLLSRRLPKGASLASGLPPSPVPSRSKPRAEEEASLRAGREILGDDSLAAVIDRLVARARHDLLAVRREGDRAEWPLSFYSGDKFLPFPTCTTLLIRGYL